MAVLDALPFPCDVQMSDGAAVGNVRHVNGLGSSINAAARYNPFWQNTNTADRPVLDTPTGGVGNYARFKLAADSVNRTTRFWHRFAGSKAGEDSFADDRPSDWEMEFVVYTSADLGAGNLEPLELEVESGDNDGTTQPWLLRMIGASNTVFRIRDYAAGSSSNKSWSSHIAPGNIYSVRIRYRASTGTGNDDGTLTVALASGDCIVNDHRGVTTTWTQVLNVTDHDGGRLHRLKWGWSATAAGVANAGHGVWIKGFSIRAASAESITGGSASWFRLHRRNIEKIQVWEHRTDNLIHLAVSIVHHYGLVAGDGAASRPRARIRVFTSLANLMSGTAAFNGSYQNLTDDGNGYWIATDRVNGLSPETEYWVEVQMQAYDGSADYFVRGDGGEYARFRTPALEGAANTYPMRLHLRGCENIERCGPTARTLAENSGQFDPATRVDLLLETGDNIGGYYMDEVMFDKAGNNYQGAETDEQMAYIQAMGRHAHWNLIEAARAPCLLVMSDHDCSVNDARRPELWADGTTAQWGTGGAGNPIDNTKTQRYQITPRALQDRITQHNIDRVYNCMVHSGQIAALNYWRHLSTGNKYGTTAHDADDSGYSFVRFGRQAFLMLALRDFANFVDGSALFGQAKTTIEGWIGDIDTPNTTLWIVASEWMTGFDETDGILKDNDNPSSAREHAQVVTDLTALRDACNANSNVSRVVILTYDHHFEAVLDLQRNADDLMPSAMRWQVSCGGVSGLAQPFENLGSGVDLTIADRLGYPQGNPCRAHSYIDVPVSGDPVLEVGRVTGSGSSASVQTLTLSGGGGEGGPSVDGALRGRSRARARAG